jgi:hypothetical protein
MNWLPDCESGRSLFANASQLQFLEAMRPAVNSRDQISAAAMQALPADVDVFHGDALARGR